MERESQFFPSILPAKRSLVPKRVLWILNLVLLFFHGFWLILSTYIKLFCEWHFPLEKKMLKVRFTNLIPVKTFHAPFFADLDFVITFLYAVRTQDSASSRGTERRGCSGVLQRVSSGECWDSMETTWEPLSETASLGEPYGVKYSAPLR